MFAVMAAGCVSGETASVRLGEVADPAEVVYEVSGEAALPLAAGLTARGSRSSILPAGYVEGTESEGGVAVGDDGPRIVHGRLELRRRGGRVSARVSLYGRPRETIRPGRGVTRLVAVYELELPPAELALALDELDATGAFATTERPDGGARLTIGPEEEPKSWTPEPWLDDLAERVVREGREVPRRLPRGAGTARVRAAGA